MTATTLEDLGNKVDEAVRRVAEPPLLVEARAMLNEAGIVKARAYLRDMPDVLEAAQADFRKAQEAERLAREAYDQALSEAEWELDSRFVVEGNKTYLVDGEERRSMTADERAKWKATEAKKLPSVKSAATALYAAEQHTAAMRDAVAATERRFSAAKHDLEASIAIVSTLRLALGTNAKETT